MLSTVAHSVPSHHTDTRLQLTCIGISKQDPALTQVRQIVLQLLSAQEHEIGLAVLRVEQYQTGLHRCDTQLFGRGLEHVGGYAEHRNATEAVKQSVHRALRALSGSGLHNPWTSSP